MRIIPAIDIMDGKCVRLTNGDYNRQTIYNNDPLEVARQFEDAGLTRLHLVDLNGAKKGEVQNWKVLERIANKTNLTIDFSGGISTKEQVTMSLSAGAFYISIGSMAVKNEIEFSSWLVAYGPERFIIAADVKDEMIQIKGWTESTTMTVFDLVGKYKEKRVKQFFCTDISRDGLLQGTACDLYSKILFAHPDISLIASGGVSTMKDLEELKRTGCSGVIIGKAIYENRISLNELTTCFVKG